MIFRRALLRELSLTAAGLFLVLLGILFTNLMLRLLGRAAGGSVASEGVFALIGFNAVYYLPVLLAVTLYLTVLLTLTRAFRDSEMIVWFTSGRSLTAWLRPILLFAAPFVAIIAAMSLVLSPWAEKRQREFLQQLDAREEFSALTPGLFKEFRRVDLVVFVESINTFDGTIRNVFAQSTEHGREITLIARSGRLENQDNGDRFIILEDGRRYEVTPGTPELRILEFERLGRRLEPREVEGGQERVRAKSTPTLFLEAGPAEKAELFWRFGVPVSSVLLVLLAIPLAYVNPRMGRSFNLVAAALVYMIYNNTLSVVQTRIALDRLPAIPSFVLVHLAVALVVALLFYRRLVVFRWGRRG
jgi:lipopolysaccharide export system permease protein